PQGGNRTIFSDAIPGWSFHNGETSASVTTSNLVDVHQLSATDAPALHAELDRIGVDRTQANYALKLDSGKSITHNRFVVPESGTLRFNLHVPELSGGNLIVSLEGDNGVTTLETISLSEASGPYDSGYNNADTNRIGYGNIGFETFHVVDIPEPLRGRVATVKFEVDNGTVFLDDVFFKSVHLKLGNPTLDGQKTRPDAVNNANNYLIEKPQYSLSYNESNKGPNWVSWQLNRTWIGTLQPPERDDNLDPLDPFPWRSDSELPSELETTEGWEYRGSGFDRGHMTAREHRNRTQKDQFATFLTTNLLPQERSSNRTGAWRQLERFSRQVAQRRGWELYNIAGGYDSINDALPPENPLNLENINVPEYTWKVIMFVEPGQGIADITVNTPVIAVTMPNGIANPPDIIPPRWQDQITTVREVEELTGLDLLSNLPDEIENVIENRIYSGPTNVNDFPSVVT
ncbi:DNA/RNA non-specific endonuclease, partial [Microcoleus sp. AT9_A2]|uniref:DNA/RNA non-specific endonuclease n=3 Tax=Microcoleus TaxID=44471 RepID=UPI002FCFFA12